MMPTYVTGGVSSVNVPENAQTMAITFATAPSRQTQSRVNTRSRDVTVCSRLFVNPENVVWRTKRGSVATATEPHRGYHIMCILMDSHCLIVMSLTVHCGRVCYLRG